MAISLPIPLGVLPRTERPLVRLHRLVRRTELFDAGWYLQRYPEARGAGSDPLRHFLERGAARGFLPSPRWCGLDAEGCAALAERHGKAGRDLWRHIRLQRGPGGEAFSGLARHGREPTLVGPLSASGFTRALDRAGPTEGRLGLDLLIVDHAMGGGANRYRDEQLMAALGRGQTVGLLTYRLRQDRFLLDLCDGQTLIVIAAQRWPDLEELLRRVSIDRLLLNNLASYPDMPRTVRAFREVAAVSGARLEVPLHDYFALCPSYNLLDDCRVFCGVPDLARCRSCLPDAELPTPVLDSPRDIDAWRGAWGEVLDGAAEITAFSTSSRDLLARAYPGLDATRVAVRPHRVDYLPPRTVTLDRAAALHIGVVGEISFAKGAEVVAGLAAELCRRRSATRLTVIGTLDPRFGSDVQQTGRYRTGDLADLLERHGVNLGLVPSIWPETFCYVAEELIRLGLPVATFDLGAPAERLRGYPAGLILTDSDPARVLDRLEDFWRALAAREASTAVLAAAS